MKIAAGGVGTVASAQAFNAKSAFPYMWAWNAVGSTHGSGPGQYTVAEQQNATIENHAEGLKHTSDASESYLRYKDETTDATDKSSKLDNTLIDYSKARYLHGVYDFSGWTTNNTLIPGSLPSSKYVGSLYYYGSSGTYQGIPAAKVCGMGGGKTIIVWDMFASVFGDGISGETGPLWQNQSADVSPYHLEPYWSAGGFTAGQYMIWCGMVLSDRILTDIPLPIRTHMG